jgi:hypothetical protein
MRAGSGMVRSMADGPPDEAKLALIQVLCLEAGHIMEDTSAELALILPIETWLIAERVEQLQIAASQIAAMANAAAALVGNPTTIE